jgi:hypothetical protein
LALEAGYDIGGAITAFAVDAENNGRQNLTVVGISEDALWPFVLASALPDRVVAARQPC